MFMRSRVVENRGAVTMSFLGDEGQTLDMDLLRALEAARSPVLLVPRVAGYQAACGVDFDVTRMVPLGVYLRGQLDGKRVLDLMMQLRALIKVCIERRLPLKNLVLDDARAFFDPWTASVRFAFLPFAHIAPNAAQTRSYLAAFGMKIHPADDRARELVARYQGYFEQNVGLDPMGLERYLGSLALDALGSERARAAAAGEAEEDEAASDRPTGDVGNPAAPAPAEAPAPAPAAAPASPGAPSGMAEGTASAAGAAGEPASSRPVPQAASAPCHAAPHEGLEARRVTLPEEGIPGALHTKTSEQAARAQEMAERTRAKVAELQARGTVVLDDLAAAPLDESEEDAPQGTTVLGDPGALAGASGVEAAALPVVDVRPRAGSDVAGVPAGPSGFDAPAQVPGRPDADEPAGALDADAAPDAGHALDAAPASDADAATGAGSRVGGQRPAGSAHAGARATSLEGTASSASSDAIAEGAAGPASFSAPHAASGGAPAGTAVLEDLAAPAGHDWDDFDDAFVDDGAPLTGVLGDLDGFFMQGDPATRRDQDGPAPVREPAAPAPRREPVSAERPVAAPAPAVPPHPADARPAPVEPPRPAPAPEPPAPQARFYLTHRRTGRHVEITGAAFVVGKSKYTDFQVVGTTTVSRRHAVFHVVGDTCAIEDNASLNGTFVDGTRLAPHRRMALVGGERIRLADEEFIFEAQRPHTEGTR